MPTSGLAVVNGWAAGGGTSLHVVCDLTLASAEHAKFKQTDADVGSFDGGYGSAPPAEMVGPKIAPPDFFLRREDSPPPEHPNGARNARAPPPPPGKKSPGR